MPYDQGAGMRNQIGLVSRYNAAEVAQVMEFAGVRKWRLDVAVNVNGKSRLLPEHTEKNCCLLWQELIDVCSSQQAGVKRFTDREALVAPNGYKASVRALNSRCKPVRVFTPVSGAINKSPGENIVLVHGPGSVQNFARRAVCSRLQAS